MVIFFISIIKSKTRSKQVSFLLSIFSKEMTVGKFQIDRNVHPSVNANFGILGKTTSFNTV